MWCVYVCSGEGMEGVCGVCMCVVVRALRECVVYVCV